MRQHSKQVCASLGTRFINYVKHISMLSLIVFSVAGHTVTLEGLQEQLSSQPIVRGHFTQLRSMEMLKAPLESAGEFLLAKDMGLQWNQTAPFPVKLVLTESKLSQQFGGGETQVVDAEDNPMVFYFSHVFLSLFSGDTSELNAQFDMSLSEADNSGGWTLVLTPKSAPLNAVFQTIELSGAQYINELTLKEVRGDKTEITFFDQAAAEPVLTAEESRGFKI
ncbi:outer membrane lipoprotein carrier protein LolA [Photobacterium rosenbergii]|uniref:outer membrane lipoprotein carrier protein LolA n=1 Tax=Photobacterium rosenbergii TaxID=294936 RepID=UPI001C9928F2|nr:outer membrane lipoprotein carrier protein LolA [Photobacterium rosenbergii]MBY5944741.1 outer membrane lipoprotein carrier protein LolA [Photobacterium rosenbergii]